MPNRKPNNKPKPKRPKPTFGAQLRRLREEAGISINELEQRSGINRSTIYSAETGRREIRATNKSKLLKAIARPMGHESGNNDMPTTHLERGILAAERLALACERIANALENPTKQ